jgi:hypothetical protein
MARRPFCLAALLLVASAPGHAQIHRCPTSDGSTYLSNLPCPPRDSAKAAREQKDRDEATLRSLQENRPAANPFQERTRARALIRQQWADQAAERRRLALPPPHHDWKSQIESFAVMLRKERIDLSRPELEQVLREEAEARR